MLTSKLLSGAMGAAELSQQSYSSCWHSPKHLPACVVLVDGAVSSSQHVIWEYKLSSSELEPPASDNLSGKESSILFSIQDFPAFLRCQPCAVAGGVGSDGWEFRRIHRGNVLLPKHSRGQMCCLNFKP